MNKHAASDGRFPFRADILTDVVELNRVAAANGDMS
jgi:hypothetical protein